MKLFPFIAILVFCSLNTQAQSLPDFEFTNAKNEKITPASLPQNQPVVIVYFDPYCETCELQATKINEKAASLTNVTFVFVSWSENEENDAFSKKYLSGLKHLFVCKDDTYRLDTWFGYSEVPTIYVYNKNRQKTATFTTLVTVDELLNACNKVP